MFSFLVPATSDRAAVSAPAATESAAGAEDNRRVGVPLVLLFLLYLIPTMVALRPVGSPVMDPDIWWHLRTGEWVAQHQQVPATDPFTIYGSGKPWVAYSWLFEVLVYGLHRWLGLVGIIVYRIALA